MSIVIAVVGGLDADVLFAAFASSEAQALTTCAAVQVHRELDAGHKKSNGAPQPRYNVAEFTLRRPGHLDKSMYRGTSSGAPSLQLKKQLLKKLMGWERLADADVGRYWAVALAEDEGVEADLDLVAAFSTAKRRRAAEC
jgi:hypothetical protein